MKYATAAAFRQALDDRLQTEAAKTGIGIARLRKRVAFELFLRRLVVVAPNRWVLKGALALDFRFNATSRPTRDMDLARADDEDAAIEDFAAAQELALDDFFTFAARRTDDLDDAEDFRAIRFHITAQLAGRVFDQFVVDVGFVASISSSPDTIETSDLLSFAGIERVRVPALPLPQHVAEKFMLTPASTASPDARARDRRTSSTSCSSSGQSSSTRPNYARLSRQRSINAHSSRCFQACRPRPRPGVSPTVASQQRSTSNLNSATHTQKPVHVSTRSSPAAQPASGIPGGVPGGSRAQRRQIAVLPDLDEVRAPRSQSSESAAPRMSMSMSAPSQMLQPKPRPAEDAANPARSWARS